MMARIKSLRLEILAKQQEEKEETKNASVKEKCTYSIQTGVTIISDTDKRNEKRKNSISPPFHFFIRSLVRSMRIFSFICCLALALLSLSDFSMCVF